METSDKDRFQTENDIFKHNNRIRFGPTFYAILLVIVITAIAITGVYLELW